MVTTKVLEIWTLHRRKKNGTIVATNRFLMVEGNTHEQAVAWFKSHNTSPDPIVLRQTVIAITHH